MHHYQERSSTLLISKEVPTLRFFKILKIAEDFLSGVFFLLGIGISIYAIMMRFFNQAQYWTSELYTMLIVWAIFIGFGTALRDDAHISMDLLYEHLSERVKHYVNFFGVIVGLIFSTFFTISGFNMMLAAYSQGIKTLDLEWPIWISYIIMPIGGILFLLHFIEKGILNYLNYKNIYR